MLCTAVDVVPTGPRWVAERKIDGWRLMVEKTDRGLRLIGGRNSSDYTGQLPYLAEVLDGLPVGTILDGEITGARGWNQVQSVMTSGQPHHPNSANPALTYLVFDILALGDTDLRKRPWRQRREILEGGLAGVPHVLVSVTFDPSEQVLQDALADGAEGLVCKRTDSTYVPGKGRAWVKIKPQTTDEGEIIGFKDSDRGPHVGAFIIRMLATGAQTTVKCGTKARHESATQERDGQPATPPWIGAVIEIKHHGFGEDGVPRHPQYLRRRDDRTPAPVRERIASTTPERIQTMTPGQPSRRNYRSMKRVKLEEAVTSLRTLSDPEPSGEAYDKCVAAGGDPAADLLRAEQALDALNESEAA